jgi:pseudaminic acid cytidylyltransferase
MESRSLCVIPARGGSKRLERKNVKPLAGKPMIAYTIEAALDSGVFDRVIVSTEDGEIAAVSEEHGATVPFERPAELASDTAQVVDVVDHALEHYDEQGEEFTELGVLLPTSPLRTAADLRGAADRFRDSEEAEFLMCVTEYQFSPFEALVERDGWLEEFWDDASFYETRSQDRPDLVVDNGAAYLMDVDAYRRERIFYGEKLIPYYMPPERSVDIDERFDFEFAEFLLERQAE